MNWLLYLSGAVIGATGIFLLKKKKPLQTKGTDKQVVDFFLKKGFPLHQSIGIAGNIKAESNFNSLASGDAGTAFGIAQWRKDRLDNLKEFADDNNLDYRDFKTQLEFILYEMQVFEKTAYQKLIDSKTIESATLNFAKYYERPQASLIPKRVAYSNEIAKKYI